jgi:ATP/maltotriose-dependent transcriptional regulator MalT
LRRRLAESDQAMGRARILCAAAEILIATGDIENARAAADELTSIASKLGSSMLRAYAALGAGSVLLGVGDACGALAALRSAVGDWIELAVPYEEARTRSLIADACDALGDSDCARMERRAATSMFDGLGVDVAQHREVGSAPAAGLTTRETEVLALVAQGKSNRAIAAALCISEKTVASHLNHVFTKLGLASRSAATAYAYQHDLVS